MDIYTQKSRWKIYLLVVALIIFAISSIYTNYIAQRLKEGETAKVELYAKAMEDILDEQRDLEEDLTFQLELISVAKDIPVILVDEYGKVSESNFPEGTDLDAELEKMKTDGFKLEGGTGYNSLIYYRHTRLLTLLTYFPIIQV